MRGIPGLAASHSERFKRRLTAVTEKPKGARHRENVLAHSP